MTPNLPGEYQQEVVISHQIAAALAATTTFKVARARRRMRIDLVEMVWNAQITEGATYYTIQLKNGSTVIASWSFQTGNQGTLAADTFGTLVLSSTDTDLIVDAGEELSLVATKNGAAANLPGLGRVNAFGRYV